MFFEELTFHGLPFVSSTNAVTHYLLARKNASQSSLPEIRNINDGRPLLWSTLTTMFAQRCG